MQIGLAVTGYKYTAVLSNVYFPKLHLNDTAAQQQSTFSHIENLFTKKQPPPPKYKYTIP